jgi:hypothetical protein
MHRIIASSLITLDALFLLSSPPALAQIKQTRTETTECAEALQAAKNKITKGRKVKVVEVYKTNVQQFSYTDYPKKRPFSYTFTLSGAATASIIKSEKFLLSISTEIIKNCNSVSMVRFGLHASDSGVDFGLVGEKNIRLFECIEPGSPTKLTWGYVICI